MKIVTNGKRGVKSAKHPLFVELIQIASHEQEFVFHCPVCRDNHVHKDELDPAGLTFYCEQGHLFNLAFKEHKGQTILSVTTIGEVEL